MPKKKILFVGDALTAELLEPSLVASGYELAYAESMMEAVEHLRNSPDAQQTQVLTQDAINIWSAHRPDLNKDVPKEFDVNTVLGYERGGVLIKYLRDNRLIADDTPAYLATLLDAPKCSLEGITRVIHLGGDTDDIVAQLEPSLHRPDQRTMTRSK